NSLVAELCEHVENVLIRHPDVRFAEVVLGVLSDPVRLGHWTKATERTRWTVLVVCPDRLANGLEIDVWHRHALDVDAMACAVALAAVGPRLSAIQLHCCGALVVNELLVEVIGKVFDCHPELLRPLLP